MPAWTLRGLGRLCRLSPEELTRLGPFFGVYAVLFAALTLADGMALALFVSRVGADALPGCYALTATLSIAAVAGYARFAGRRPAPAVFRAILLGCSAFYVLGWAALNVGAAGAAVPAAFFTAREVASVLVLAHFGTFLQDYFTRAELNRVLPIVYAGGRLGGLLGGGLLEWLAPAIGVAQLAAVFALLMAVAAARVGRLSRSIAPVEEPAANSLPDARARGAGSNPLFAMPLFRWFAASTVLFMMVRWFLNYEYNHAFERHFDSEAELAAFLGRYVQYALALSLFVQVLMVNRLVALVGVRGAHAVTVVLLVIGLGRNLWPMTLAAAVWSRMLESELRFGLRNPINQLITNQFTKADRIRVRAWTLGALNPVAALSGSLMLGGLQGFGMTAWIPAIGFALALAHALASLALYRHLREPKQAEAARADVVRDRGRHRAKPEPARASVP